MDKSKTQLILLDEDHSGRDEMNLAGNPFALLQAASRAGQKVISHEWDRTLTDGRIVKASWRVSGDAELGLPGPTEELLYLVLLQITRELAEAEGVGAKEWPRTVYFSRLDLMRRLGWDNSARNYKQLREAFIRLSGVMINTEHSFFDARSGRPFTAIGFGIIDDYAFAEENKGRKADGHTPLSWFRWNETLHTSFLAGNVRSLALDFVLGLQLPLSRRLFRILELFRHSGPHASREWRIGLLKLRDRLGMTSYQYPSKIKEKLAPAVEELIAHGYLIGLEFQPSAKGPENAVFRFGDARVWIDADAPDATNPLPEIVAPRRAGAARARKLTEAKIAAKTPGQQNKTNLKRDIATLELALGLPAAPAPTPNLPQEAPQGAKNASESALEDKGLTGMARAVHFHAIFQQLSAPERDRLLQEARSNVPADFWDRLTTPESPISFRLWDLVEASLETTPADSEAKSEVAQTPTLSAKTRTAGRPKS